MKNGDYELVIAPPDFPGKKYRDRYCSKHVFIYWQTYGVVPNSDEIIHHKDGDRHNNDPKNLELMKRKEHSKMHGYNRGRKLVELKCIGCEKIFVREKNKSFLQKRGKYSCCCKKCSDVALTLSKSELQKRIEEHLIREFTDDKTKYGL